MRKSEKDWRIEEIRFTQKHHHPHGCANHAKSAICMQNLDGTCDVKTCKYYGLVVKNKLEGKP